MDENVESIINFTFHTQYRTGVSIHKEQFHRGISGSRGAYKCDHCGFESMDRGTVVEHFIAEHPEVCWGQTI